MRHRRRAVNFLAVGGIVVSALLQAGCNKKANSSAEDKKPDAVTVEMSTAAVRLMETTVTAQGTLTAGQGTSARVASSFPGRLLTVTVKEGDPVSMGQVLATVDNRPQQAQSHSAMAAASAAEAQAHSADLAAGASAVDQSNAVHLALLAVQSAQLDRDNSVQLAQSGLQAAETDYQKIRAGARPQEIAQADQAVNQAKATRDRASTELNRVRFLVNKGIYAQRQLDDAQTAQAVAESAMESARQQASLIRAGARAEDLRAAEIRVQQAQQALSQAKSAGDARTAQARAALKQARESALQVAVKRQDARAFHEQAAVKRADLVAAQSTAAYAVVRSPLRGIVTRRALNPGDMADTATPILEVAEVRALNLLANIASEDGLQVRPGMPAHITAADLPGRVFAGTVLNVGQVDPQTNLLSVRLSVSNGRGALRAGTFAAADIVVRTNPRAVVVPKQAIVSRDGKSVVFTVGPDKIAHQNEVTAGSERDGLVEIVKGVASGDQVIRLGQYEIADGAKVHAAEHKNAAASDSEKAAAK